MQTEDEVPKLDFILETQAKRHRLTFWGVLDSRHSDRPASLDGYSTHMSTGHQISESLDVLATSGIMRVQG
jgi:hypothetical protein